MTTSVRSSILMFETMILVHCRVKVLKIGAPRMTTIIALKLEQFGLKSAVMHPKDTDRMTNNVDPD